MKKIISALGMCIFLSGCAAAQMQSQLQQRSSAEQKAWADAEPIVVAKCLNGKKTTDIPKQSKILAQANCISQIISEKVIPSAVYPDLLMESQAKALRNDEDYAKGKISVEELQARRKENEAWYIQQINQRENSAIAQATQKDAIDEANFNQSLNQSLAAQQAARQQWYQTIQSQQPQPSKPILPTQTDCRNTYNGMDCTTY